MKDAVFAYIKKKYKVSPEYPWKRYPDNAVFRHGDNNKWFALVMEVNRDKLGQETSDVIPVINLKVDDLFYRDMLIQQHGIVPAYHMNKQQWITVFLDGSVKQDQVFDLIDASFLATASAKKKQKIRPPKEWVIPSNPKYYDIIHAFDDTDENLTIKALMKIKLQKRYKPDKFTFDVLKDEYGIYAIRGPRGITNSLSAALNKK